MGLALPSSTTWGMEELGWVPTLDVSSGKAMGGGLSIFTFCPSCALCTAQW